MAFEAEILSRSKNGLLGYPKHLFVFILVG